VGWFLSSLSVASMSISSVWNFVHAEKLSFECVVASERDRPDIA